METIYEPATETAKKIRKELKKVYPNTKFSVRSSSSYSGGSSIRVEYVSGEKPEYKEANGIVGSFSSASFDGMTDMKEYTGYMYDGKLYSGADYIFYREN